MSKPICLMTALVLPVLHAGCSGTRPPDPMGTQSSLVSRLVPGRTPGAAKTAKQAGGDPFLSSAPDVDVNQLGRAMVSDASVDDSMARDAAYLSGQPVEHLHQELFPSDMRDPDEAAAENAANLILQSQWSRQSQDESATQRRLRELELQLQLTEDHATQDQLALEIATLRKQMRKSHR